MEIKDLHQVSILGLGLLGGSLGLALDRALPKVRRVGYSHRAVTRQKALQAGCVDQVHERLEDAVRDSELIVLASPIGVFAELMEQMAEHLTRPCVVTDVGSTKVMPERWARKYLRPPAVFVGSHPMAGSEQRGVEFARADLFDGANCILTAADGAESAGIRFLTAFWRRLHMRVQVMTAGRHDRVLARISHLPHALACALVNISDPEELLLCGKGFLDTTRIASGPPNVWRDILLANPANTRRALGRLIRELTGVQDALANRDEGRIVKMLADAQSKRNDLIDKKLQRRELPE